MLGDVPGRVGWTTVRLVRPVDADQVRVADGLTIDVVLRADDPEPAEAVAFLDLGLGRAAPACACEGEVLRGEAQPLLEGLVAAMLTGFGWPGNDTREHCDPTPAVLA